jgi:hypothetical protein
MVVVVDAAGHWRWWGPPHRWLRSVTVVAIIVNIVALSLSCSSYSLAVNPRNLTKASQGSITHGMLMEQLPLGWP